MQNDSDKFKLVLAWLENEFCNNIDWWEVYYASDKDEAIVRYSFEGESEIRYIHCVLKTKVKWGK